MPDRPKIFLSNWSSHRTPGCHGPGRKRAPFWREHPAAEVRVFSERPSFTGGKTDSCAYGLFVWRAGVVETRLRWLSWRAA